MAETYKVLGQTTLAVISTYYNICSTGAATSQIVSCVTICNRGANAATYRLSIGPTSGTPANSEFIVYDASIAGNDTISLSLGLVLGNSYYLKAYSSTTTNYANLTFSAFGVEIS